MHEAALCEDMIDIIREHQRLKGFTQVRRVVVEVGVLGHVEPQALTFAFDVLSKGSPAEGARLEIITVIGRAHCIDCEDDIDLGSRGDPCPLCGGYNLLIQQGDELRLKELEVI